MCHPDFISGHKAFAIVNEKLYGPAKSVAATPPSSASVATGGKTVATEKSTTTSNLSTINGNNPSGSSVYPLSSNDSEGFFSSFFGAKKGTKKGGILEPIPTILKASGQVSERELIEIEVISRIKLCILFTW